jgi:hypothetical protein
LPFRSPPRQCVFCDEPETSKRIFISDYYGLWLICNRCIAKAAALIARRRKTVRHQTTQLIECASSSDATTTAAVATMIAVKDCGLGRNV